MRCSIAILFSFLALSPLRAVIVAGANGGSDNLNNTTASQIQASLGISGAFYENVIRYSDAGSVYLGWRNTVGGPRAYVLSAMHITFANTMVINGVTYSVSRESISSSDLALLTLTQTSGIMPPLPAMELALSTPSVGSSIVMAGFGRERVQAATTSASVSDAVAVTEGTGYTSLATTEKRWGTNATATFGPGPNVKTTTASIGGRTTTLTQTIFTQPTSGQWLTTNESQAVVGDSGGGMFDLSGRLIGITASVSGSNVNEAYFGEATYFTDVPTYKAAIETAIGGALIPEPSVYALLVFALASASMLRWTAAIRTKSRQGVSPRHLWLSPTWTRM